MALTLNESLNNLQLSGIRRITAKAKQKPGCILLTLGEPDGNTAEPVKACVAASLAENDTHYPPNNGKDFLREAIARTMEARGVHYAPDEIIATCGATEALFVALTCVMNPGDEVIVPTPAFGLYESIVTLNRGVFVPLDTRADAFQIRAAALDATASERTKAIVLTSPNNPTGCVYDEESLAAVAAFAAQHDVYVICDDVYANLVYDDAPYRGFACRYPELRDRVIVCDSFSKPYAMTGWRLGWVAADASIAAEMAKIHQYMVSSVPSFVQRAAACALEHTLPVTMQTAEDRLGVSNQVSRFVLPICTTINMNGCAAFILVTSLFLMQNGGMPLPWTTMILWLFISVISAVGNAGVPMGCYFLTLSLMSGINAPIGIMGIILPIYTIIDMIETAENVWSDSCVCAMVDRDLKR